MRAIVPLLKIAPLGFAVSLIIQEAHAAEKPEPLQIAATVAGKVVYDSHCAVCHGVDGKGDGAARYLLFPKPTDFTAGKFKLRSTASGSPPRDQDLLLTLARGVPGAGMPSFAFLSEEEREAVAQ